MTRCVLLSELSCCPKCPLPAAPTPRSPEPGRAAPRAGSAGAGAELRACEELLLHTNTTHVWVCSVLILQYLFLNVQTPSPDNIPGQSKVKKIRFCFPFCRVLRENAAGKTNSF